MGLIRITLALAVLFSHMPTSGIKFLGGALAVQCFFIISGFYMALVLADKYASARLFYTNRALRLFPSYLVVVLAAALFLFVMGGNDWFVPSLYERIYQQPGVAALMVFENLFLVGQELLFWFSVDPNGALVFDTRGAVPVNGTIVAWQGLLVPQAWSISMELLFYAIAPFVLRWRWQAIAALALASIALRFAGMLLPVDYLLWQGRLFPTALFLFLLGALSFRLLPLAERAPRWAGWAAMVVLIGWMAAFLHVGLPMPEARWLMYASVALATPLVFAATRRLAWDRWVGNLSYPFYIVHLLVLIVLGRYLPDPAPWIGVTVTLVVSALLMVLVDMPVDRWRQRRVEASEQPAPF